MTAFGVQLIKLPACPCHPLLRPGLARSRPSSGSSSKGNICFTRAESGGSSGDNTGGGVYRCSEQSSSLYDQAPCVTLLKVLTPADSKDESAETLFQKELQRRESRALVRVGAASTSGLSLMTRTSMLRGFSIWAAEQNQRSSGRTSTSQTEPPPPFNKEEFRSQLERSRKLNSEGLEVVDKAESRQMECYW